jgi:hypothetical protein
MPRVGRTSAQWTIKDTNDIRSTGTTIECTNDRPEGQGKRGQRLSLCERDRPAKYRSRRTLLRFFDPQRLAIQLCPFTAFPQTSLLLPPLHRHPPHFSPHHVILPFNYDPAPSPSASVEHDDTPGSLSHGNSEAFNVMERSVTPPGPSQPPLPLPEARRNFTAASTLVAVQGVVHTSDIF